jgi:hypothetical protein
VTAELGVVGGDPVPGQHLSVGQNRAVLPTCQPESVTEPGVDLVATAAANSGHGPLAASLPRSQPRTRVDGQGREQDASAWKAATSGQTAMVPG